MENQYTNLPEENRQYLLNLINRTKNETKLLSSSLSSTEKTRRLNKDKILFCLLYGIEEIKTHLNDESYWENIKSDLKNEIKRIMSDNQEQIKFCKKLALQIETMIFLEYKERVDDFYKRKIGFDLYLNMHDVKNEILRKKIIFGIIPYEQLTRMSAEELANPEKKEKLKEQRKKFVKEQMLLTEETKVINHKEVTSNTLVGDEVKEETNNYDLINYQNNNFKNKKESEHIKEKREENKNKSDKNAPKEKSKLSGLSSELLNFYFEIDEFRKETLIKKINEKINGNLKEDTVNEIKEKRKKFNVNLNV